MSQAIRTLAVRNAMSLAVAMIALSFSGCPGPDRLTDPLVSEGGTYFAATGGTTELSSLGGSGGSSVNKGGTASINDASANGADASGFDWGPTSYDITSGSSVAYQDHLNGERCFAACHDHAITVGGTAYQADGTSTASNGQIGIWLNGALFTSYVGSNGNFFTNFFGKVDWTNAAIAVRNENGTKLMPANPNASGDCNYCHIGNHRIIVP